MSSLVQSMAVPVTEDTPPDLLAGSMDLTVLLPDGRATKTSVQRATAMLDLLVQLCTAHRLSPGAHSLQPLGEKGALPFKPSTPIGLLDAWSVRLLPKGATTTTTTTGQDHPHQLPFQHTFRLQVHLPRNQLLVSRVTPQMGLAAVLEMACEEKNLDPSKYELRHPINLEERLRPELTLGDYGLTEVCVMSRGGGAADALALQREQERRRRRARHQHGHVAPPPPPAARQQAGEGSAVTGSVSSGSLGGRSSSPDSTPAAPPPRAPARKRRPAPPPPDAKARASDKREPAVVITRAASEQVVSHRDGTTPTVTHSRTSSDSSGYHEASVLSDGPDTHPGDKTISTREMPPPTSNSTLPRRSKLPPATGTTSAVPPKRSGPTVANSVPLSRSVSNLASAAPGRVVHGEHSTSTSSLSSTGRGPRKKKAAPPPPPVAAAPAKAPGGTPDAAVPPPAETRPSDAPVESRAPSRPVPSAGNSDARRAAGIEEEKEQPDPERRPSREAEAKHHQQQQRSSAELPAEKADLYAELQRRLPSRGHSLSSTSSSGSDDAAAPAADGKRASAPAPAVRPSRSRDRASATPGDRADGQSRPQPDVVAVQAAPPAAAGKPLRPKNFDCPRPFYTESSSCRRPDLTTEIENRTSSPPADVVASCQPSQPSKTFAAPTPARSPSRVASAPSSALASPSSPTTGPKSPTAVSDTECAGRPGVIFLEQTLAVAGTGNPEKSPSKSPLKRGLKNFFGLKLGKDGWKAKAPQKAPAVQKTPVVELAPDVGIGELRDGRKYSFDSISSESTCSSHVSTPTGKFAFDWSLTKRGSVDSASSRQSAEGKLRRVGGSLDSVSSERSATGAGGDRSSLLGIGTAEELPPQAAIRNRNNGGNGKTTALQREQSSSFEDGGIPYDVSPMGVGSNAVHLQQMNSLKLESESFSHSAVKSSAFGVGGSGGAELRENETSGSVGKSRSVDVTGKAAANLKPVTPTEKPPAIKIERNAGRVVTLKKFISSSFSDSSFDEPKYSTPVSQIRTVFEKDGGAATPIRYCHPARTTGSEQPTRAEVVRSAELCLKSPDSEDPQKSLRESFNRHLAKRESFTRKLMQSEAFGMATAGDASDSSSDADLDSHDGTGESLRFGRDDGWSAKPMGGSPRRAARAGASASPVTVESGRPRVSVPGKGCEARSRDSSPSPPPPPLPSTAPPPSCPPDGAGSAGTAKVSIFTPPPPDVRLNRGESAESWNMFLQQLDEILERHAEFV